LYINTASIKQFLHGETPSDITLNHYVSQHLKLYSEIEPEVRAFVPESDHVERLTTTVAQIKEKYRDQAKPALYGIPVAIKDLFHIDGWQTRAGSSLPSSLLTGEEGQFIKRLRELGVILAGKTVTEEFAYASSIPTVNPHNPNHSPGGSSAGSAAAVAAGLCPLAIGTQTLRSVIAPASFCGVVGFKPSYGRIPIDGLQLLSPSYDTVGLFAQDIESMEYFAQHVIFDWSTFTDQKETLPVVGIPKGKYMELMFDDVKFTFQQQVHQLEEAGIQVKRVDMPWDDDFIFGSDMLHFVQAEMAIVHESYMAQYEHLYGVSVHDGILNGRTIERSKLDEYRSKQLIMRQKINDVQVTEGVDIWISPAQGGFPPTIGKGNGYGGMTQIWSYAGCPEISIPAAIVNGLPLGFQCISSYGQDEQLIYWSKKISRLLNKYEVHK